MAPNTALLYLSSVGSYSDCAIRLSYKGRGDDGDRHPHDELSRLAIFGVSFGRPLFRHRQPPDAAQFFCLR
jgi:hypothetical protein